MTEIKVIRKGESKNFKVKVKGVTLKNKEIIMKVVEDLTLLFLDCISVLIAESYSYR